jgi:hypothetical protein
MVGLVLPVLLLAAASDFEGSSEEDWTERFAWVNEERKKIGIPLLTAKERMLILIGQHEMKPGFYVVGYQLIDVSGVQNYLGWRTCVFKTDKDGYARTSVLECPLHKFEDSSHPWSQRETIESDREIEKLAYQLMIPYSVSLHRGGNVIDLIEIGSITYPW